MNIYLSISTLLYIHLSIMFVSLSEFSSLKGQLTPHQHAILIDLGRTFPNHGRHGIELNFCAYPALLLTGVLGSAGHIQAAFIAVLFSIFH